MKKMWKRSVSFLCMLVILASQLAGVSFAYTTSDWVLASGVPAGAEIVDRKWVYTKTTNTDSKTANLAGYTLKSSEWVKSGTGSKNYASFPSGFDTSHSIYTSFAKSAYTTSETTTAKRTVSNVKTGYVYWHWMYDCGSSSGTSKRAIYNKKGSGPDNGFYYKYFGAFTSTNGDYSSDKYYCNSLSITNYIIPERTAYSACQGATRWFRFNYYTSTYIDYYKLFHYTKTETLESTTKVTASSTSTATISNVQEYVKYKSAYTVTFDANGGSGGPTTQAKPYGTALTLSSAEPTKTGYAFLGWATNKSATSATYKPGDSFTANSDTTLYAVWAVPSGQCGSDLNWRYDLAARELIITGSGPMNDYDSGDAVPWWPYRSIIEKVTIPSAVTTIGAYCFAGCAALTAFSMPTSLNAIGEKAFIASGLEGVTIPSGVTVLGYKAFYNCSNLRAVSLPDGLKTIGDSAFTNCAALKKLTLPDSVEQIGKEAFRFCSGLRSVNIPAGLTEISDYLFTDTALTELEIPDGVRSIGESAFAGCTELTTLTISDTVEAFGTDVFLGDTSLRIRCYLDAPAYVYAQENEIPVDVLSRDQLRPPVVSFTNVYQTEYFTLSAVEGATIYYTLDGSEPTLESPVYSESIKATGAVTLKAFCTKLGWQDSSVTTFQATGKKVSMPTADIATGTRISTSTELRFHCGTEDAELWYTTTGDSPYIDNPDRQLYTGPFRLERPGETVDICVIAFKDGWLSSSPATFSYDVSEEVDPPVITYLPADIGTETATLSVCIDSKDELTSAVLCWYPTNDSASRVNADLRLVGNTATYTVKGLESSTDYCYFVKAENLSGWEVGDTCTFTTLDNTSAPPRVELNQAAIKLREGKQFTLLATILPVSLNSWVYWQSSDTSVARVSDDGMITAVGEGRCTITASILKGAAAQCQVQVLPDVPVGEFDFSEKHMIMHATSLAPYGVDSSATEGGNALMATAYLARWEGAVLEADDPFPSDPPQKADVGASNYRDAVADKHVQSVLFLPYRTNSLDNDHIKRAIMNYGAVYTSFFESENCYCGDHYYYSDAGAPRGEDHAVAIVGWDDSASRFSFKDARGACPPGNGAFICKNSRSENYTYSSQGYFYVSYYDVRFARNSCDYNAVFYNLQSAENYNKIYQYDFLGPTQLYHTGASRNYIANVFPEQGHTLEEDEVLKAVSFYNYAPGTSYKVYVVEDYQGPESLQRLNEPVAVGTRQYTSYDTVELEVGIPLKAGTRYAVVVELTGDDEIFLEAPVVSLGYSTRKAAAGKDESYLRTRSGSWRDVTELVDNANVCVKAFTRTNNAQALLFGTDMEAQVEAPSGEASEEAAELFAAQSNSNGALSAIAIPGLTEKSHGADGAKLPASYDLRIGQQGVTPVKNQGGVPGCWSFAAYASLESTTMLAEFRGTTGSFGSSAGTREIELNQENLMLAVGDSFQLLATLFPYDSSARLYWESSGDAVSVSPRGFVTAAAPGQATVTVKTSDGSVTNTCEITVVATEALESLRIAETEDTLWVGDVRLMRYTTFPWNADKQSITWSSSDDAVAQIDEYGYLRAVGYGLVTLTASSGEDGPSDTVCLFVDDGRSFSTDITDDGLQCSDDRLTGELTVAVENLKSADTEVQVCVAFYSQNGMMLRSYTKTVQISAAQATVSFSELNIPYEHGDTVTVRVFLLSADKGKALAPPTERALT